jgi:hypothetical protein
MHTLGRKIIAELVILAILRDKLSEYTLLSFFTSMVDNH